MTTVAKPPKLLDQVRNKIRLKHYSLQTEKSYIHWIRRFIYFNNIKHPKDMGGKEVSAFLTFLASKRNVAASTQNQALCALIFLYHQVLDIRLPQNMNIKMAKRPQRLPVVLSKKEVTFCLN